VLIEGATNSSFLNEIGGIYGSDRVLVYKVSTKRFIRLCDLALPPGVSLINKGMEILSSTPLLNSMITNEDPEEAEQKQTYSRRDLPPDTRVVLGHFTPNFFSGVFDNPFISIILKDPLERIIDLYNEWMACEGSTDWRFKITFDRTLGFKGFSELEEMVNYQSLSLGSKRLGDYDLVGVAECQPGFIAQLKNKDWTGFSKRIKNGYQLEKPRYRKLEIDHEFLEKFRSNNELDYSIYQQAKSFISYCE
jgi:hypothetical protein